MATAPADTAAIVVTSATAASLLLITNLLFGHPDLAMFIWADNTRMKARREVSGAVRLRLAIAGELLRDFPRRPVSVPPGARIVPQFAHSKARSAERLNYRFALKRRFELGSWFSRGAAAKTSARLVRASSGEPPTAAPAGHRCHLDPLPDRQRG